MSGSRDLPVIVKIAVIIGGLLLVRFLTVAVLPGALAWPAYIVFWVWVIAFWTGGGSLRT